MPDSSRIEELRRRVERDPASIAFAQLAEEYRRAGAFGDSVATCRAGLTLHPGYLSARVTLGRALIELGELDEAQQELERVRASAPENLAAIRGIAEIHHRRGDVAQALDHYRDALALARNDPDLEETVADLERQVAPKRADPGDGLSLEQMRSALALHVPPPPVAPPVQAAAPEPVPELVPDPVLSIADSGQHAGGSIDLEPAAVTTPVLEEPAVAPVVEDVPMTRLVEEETAAPRVELLAEPPHMGHAETIEEPGRPADVQTLERLEAFLSAIHADRTQRRA